MHRGRIVVVSTPGAKVRGSVSRASRPHGHSKRLILRSFPAHMMDDRNQPTACTHSPGHQHDKGHHQLPVNMHSLPRWANGSPKSPETSGSDGIHGPNGPDLSILATNQHKRHQGVSKVVSNPGLYRVLVAMERNYTIGCCRGDPRFGFFTSRSYRAE